jgi:hypothetical protein
MLSEESQAQKDKCHIFSHIWKIDIKDIHKNNHDHIQTHTKNMFVIVELLFRTQGRRERKRE